MRSRYLLGVTENFHFVFGEIELRKTNHCAEGELEFSVCFYDVMPFNGDDFDLVEYYEDFNEGLPKEYLYDLCKIYNCPPSQLSKVQADECKDVRDAIDCSLYPECYCVNGKNYYFESCGCGQYDSSHEIKDVTNLKAYILLHDLWYKYHLKVISPDVIEQVEEIRDMLSEIDEKEWIVNYIKENQDVF